MFGSENSSMWSNHQHNHTPLILDQIYQKIKFSAQKNVQPLTVTAVDGPSRVQMSMYFSGQAVCTVLYDVKILKKWLKPQKLRF